MDLGPTFSVPAFYVTGRGRQRDVRAVLHLPYTAWHLSYVVLGATLAPRVNWATLLDTLGAFFLAVGVAAHALDELHGRPLGTQLPGWLLALAAGVGLAGAGAFGGYGVTRVGLGLLVFIVVGAAIVVSYNLEIGGGIVHNDWGFALGWGAFPVLTAYFAQTGSLSAASVAAALAACCLSGAQRSLSTPARVLRRQVRAVTVDVRLRDGRRVEVGKAALLVPLERALLALSWAMVTLAVALCLAR